MYLLDVLEEHAEEAGFLWMMRQGALRSWNYDLKDLADLEERLFAHLDGLLIGEEAAAEILEPYLTGGEEGEAFAAAFTALASGDAKRLEHVFEVFEQAEGETLDGIRHALRHTGNAEAVAKMSAYLESDEPRITTAAIDVMSFRRLDNCFTVLHLLPDRPAQVRAAALEAVGRMGDANYLLRVEEALSDPDPAVQRAALRAGFILGSEDTLTFCRELVTNRATNADEAVHLLGLAGLREDQALIFNAARDETLQPHAILALGAHGYADIIDPLLEFAKELKDLRGVGCVVSRITGVDLDDEGLEAPIPSGAVREGEEPTLDELEAELAAPADDPYEGLPAPDLEKIHPWWQQQRNGFDAPTRVRHGQPFTATAPEQVLGVGSMPECHAGALELGRAGHSCSHTERFVRTPVPGRYCQTAGPTN